ncbi:MAG TPA: hypothetical protein VMV28_06080 [Thermoplasmata archaeon]|nr:hypothetical protein [Thermoplasmata archaeon]
MLEIPRPPVLEHLTPHDLVTYFHCPHEMELMRTRDPTRTPGPAGVPVTPADVVPLRHSPMFSPPLSKVEVYPGRIDIAPDDHLVYQDEGEDGLPMLFPPERIRLDARYREGARTLVDPELNFAGRPDLVIARKDGALVPLEYKSTHLFVGYHEAHGRLFDTVQAIAECRLVHAAFGKRPPYALILYGDQAGDGEREGWVRIPYTEADEHWLRAALVQIRADRVRPPVPAERNCASCEANEAGRCRFAAARYDGPHHRAAFLASPRPDLR